MKKLFLLLSFYSISLCSHQYNDRPIIVLDPAGHAGDVGRWLVEGYERAQTFELVQAVKLELLKKAHAYPFISRSTGELILPLQIPSFSNRLGATIFLRIHMYREENEKPQLFWHHLQFDPIVDGAQRNFDSLSLTPVHQSHFKHIDTTKFYGNKICEYLSARSFRRYFDCYALEGLPLKRLIGVTAKVALLLEIGICRENKWKSLVKPIVDSLCLIIDDLAKQEG